MRVCGVALFVVLAFLLARKQCGQHLQNSQPKVCSLLLELLSSLDLVVSSPACLPGNFYCLFVLYFLRTICCLWASECRLGFRGRGCVGDGEWAWAAHWGLYASMARRALDNGVPAYCLHWLFSLILIVCPSLGFSIICRQLSEFRRKNKQK